MPSRHGVPLIYRWHKLCNKDLLSKRHEACDQTSITSTCTSTCGSKAEGGGADITTAFHYLLDTPKLTIFRLSTRVFQVNHYRKICAQTYLFPLSFSKASSNPQRLLVGRRHWDIGCQASYHNLFHIRGRARTTRLTIASEEEDGMNSV